MSNLGTQRAGPTFGPSGTKQTMAAAAGAPAAKTAPAAAVAAPAAAATKPKSASAARGRPTTLPESLKDMQAIPPQPLSVVPSPRGPGGEPMAFVAWGSQQPEGLPTFSDIGKSGTPGSEVFGVFVTTRGSKIIGLTIGTAILVINKARTEVVAHPAKFVGTAPELDTGKLRESLVALFASPKHDYIPTLDATDFDLAVKIYELYKQDRSLLRDVLPLAGKPGTPWKLPATREKLDEFHERLRLVIDSIGSVKVSKPRAPRPPAAAANDDDDDFMDVTVPVAPAESPRKRPAAGDTGAVAPAAKKQAVAGADGKPKAAKFTGQLIVSGPETVLPVLLIPVALYRDAKELFDRIGVAGFSEDPHMVSLTLTKTAMDDELRAMLDALTPSQLEMMAAITQPTTLMQTIVLDCSNQTQPVTVTQADGSRATGTIGAVALPASHVYTALLQYRLKAVETTRAEQPETSEGDEEEEEEDDDDGEEEVDDVEADDDDEYDQ